MTLLLALLAAMDPNSPALDMTRVTLDVAAFPFPPTEHVIIANMGRPLFTCDVKCTAEVRKCRDMNCQRCAWLRSTERDVKAVACHGGSATTR